MPRQRRCLPPGLVYHALNRTVARACLFEKPPDYDAFERVLGLAFDKVPVRILGYCLMPNHWHFVLWPEREGQMTAFLRWLTHTHTQRWHAHYHSAGTGHLYQGRFRAFPVQEDDHLLTVLRYVERNPLRAGLVAAVDGWNWNSLSLFRQRERPVWYSDGPVPRGRNWLAHVAQPQTDVELVALRRSVNRGCPYGSERWQGRTITALGLESTLRPRGRPRRLENEA